MEFPRVIFAQTVTIGAEKIRKQSGPFPYPVRRPLSWSVQAETLQNAGSGAGGVMPPRIGPPER